MKCRECGTDNRDGAKFCRKCGHPLQQEGRGHRRVILWTALVSLFVLAAVGVTILVMRSRSDGSGPSQTDDAILIATPEESFDEYTTLHEGISAIEDGYVDEDGYVASGDIPELIREVKAYVEGLPEDAVSSYDVGEEYVQVDLACGLTYVYSPRREHMLDRGDGMMVSSYEQETEAFSDDRDHVIELFNLRAEPEELSVYGNSLLDSIAWYMANSDSNQFHLDEFYDDEDVTLDVIKGFRSNRVILWEGHGTWTEQLGPQLQLSQKIDFLWWQKIWGEDFTEKRLVAYGDTIAVTCAFFSHYYEAGDLQDSVIYLGSCYSLRDDRLASILAGKGASLVIGNTNPVSSFYQYEMRDSILSDMADCRMTVSDALKNAKAVYGDEDPWCDDGEHTKVKYYPSNAGKVTLYGTGEERHEREDGKELWGNYEYFASRFVYEWRNDWSFEDGHDVPNDEPFPDRCLPYIDPESDFYREFSESVAEVNPEYWWWDVAICVIGEPETRMVSDRTCRVTIGYGGTQVSVDQARYDRMVENPSVLTYDVTMNGACKVIGVEKVEAPDDSASQVPAQTDTNPTNGKTSDGRYRLSGTVRVHEEDFRGQRIDTVVSIVLDEAMPYEYEYRGRPSQYEAHEVLLATSGAEFFGANEYEEWAQYDGRHITVDCENLQLSYHDASYWKVDTLAYGEINLVSADDH